MRGMSRSTGQVLDGVEHLQQSIADILTTPIGSRVMRRDYGSRLFDLIDRPVNDSWLVDCYAWTAEALLRWEPRIKLRRVSISSIEEGRPVLDLEASYLIDGKPITLEGIQL